MVDFTGSGLRITDYGLRITDYGLRITDYGLRITDYGLRITDYGLRIADCGLRIVNPAMQIVYFFGKKPQELPVATCSYAMPPRKWLYIYVLVITQYICVRMKQPNISTITNKPSLNKMKHSDSNIS
jgi:hypothetical protein